MWRKGLASLAIGAVLLLVYLFFPSVEKEGHCVFCDAQVITQQKIFEEASALALYSHKPIFPGHSLIIPVRHVERFEELTQEELEHIQRLIKKVHQAVSAQFGTSAYLILQKNGVEVGQSVSHLHFHYIPRKKDDASKLKFLLKALTAQVKKSLSKEQLKEIKAELQMRAE